MKTILYMSLTADGRFAQADEAHPIPREILAGSRALLSLFDNANLPR
jgi:hypothetical protein